MATGLSIAILIATVLMVLWLWIRPQTSAIGLLVQSMSGLALIAAGWSAAIWTVVPRWPILIVLLFWATASFRACRRDCPAIKPVGIGAYLATLFFAALFGLGGWATREAMLGQKQPAIASINLELPLDGRDLSVANGGSRLLINAHQDTLDLSIPRHRLWQGQSYAVDFVALRRWGFTANGLQPADPARYAIFGKPVKAPCTGQIVRLKDGRPDMPVPQIDPGSMEGNYVMLRCGSYEILMAHLKRGSIGVKVGDQLAIGTQIGRVGNSGHSTEPHLHINAQTPGTDAAPFSGKPVAMLFNGKFLARNDRPRR